jgi:pantoate--beta-alanine ligase
MRIIDTVAAMQSVCRSARKEGKTIALVPTMGYLHDGHASLMIEGRKQCDLLVTSIFVNPTQFGVNEDLDKYPRDLERDCAIAQAAGVDIIFAPTAADMYPGGYQTYVNVEQVSLPLCGASRPGHFRGVTTVVAKLFNIIQPHLALFGKKDYQQLAVIRTMVTDLNMDIDIIGMPIVREADGLAMSSRNSYLNGEQRQMALCLSKGIRTARRAYQDGERSIAMLQEKVRAIIQAEPGASIDYVEFLDGDTLTEQTTADARTLLALAVKIGPVRLIDNHILGEEFLG